MKAVLYNYDIYPLAFPVGKQVTLTIKPLGDHAAFSGEYWALIHRVDAGNPNMALYSRNKTEYAVTPDADGCLRMDYTAEAECQHFVRIYQGEKQLAELSVYALEPDLACRRPFRGDLHIHTFYSDGREAPAVVCANYRKKGYDFIVITDHEVYYPSLKAIKAFRNVESALTVLPGEEVHLTRKTDVHIVNAGGLFSVNGLLPNANYRATNGEVSGRCAEGLEEIPEMRDEETFNREIEAIEQTLTDCPADVDSHSYAICLWIFDKIRQGGGLGIFAHPYWLANMWNVPEPFTKYMLEKHPFDAFEVLGGENYYTQNGFQTAIYYDEYRQGRVHPIVGSTDSHGSTDQNRNWDICSTIVFASKNERTALIQAVKDRYSVAVDTISKEYRLVGEFRLQKYASFLMENYFPIHDRQAALDGEILYQYVVGNATPEEVNLMSKRAQVLMDKYFLTE